MNFVITVTVLALVQFVFFGALVARARRTYNVAAPAVTGAPEFERIYRVHMNTLERLALFLPLMWIAAQFGSAQAVAAVGVVFLVGRLLYWKAYVADPAKRGLGNVLSMLPVGVLLVLTVVGLVQSPHW